MNAAFALQHPEGMCLGRSGSLWLCDSGLGLLLHIVANSGDGVVVHTIGAGAGEQGLHHLPARTRVGPFPLAQVPLHEPCALALCADEQRVFVVDKRAPAVWRIDLAADSAYLLAWGQPVSQTQTRPQVGASVPALGGLMSAPRSIAVDEDVGCLYLALTACDQIWRLDLAADPADGQLVALAGAASTSANVADIRADHTFANARFSAPRGIALAPDRKRLYLADSGHRAVRILHLADARVTTLVHGTVGGTDDLSGCTEVAIGPGGLLVVDADGDAIYGVNPRHRTLVRLVWTGDVQLTGPSAMVFDREHHGYVIADSGNSRLVRLMRDMSAATEMRLVRQV